GPEGGDRGGEVVTQAPPEVLAARAARSHTGKVLGEFLEARGNGANR
ncbi:MAG: excinuclease ABC subunit A, partial [Rhodocyclaceae bacterium]|nr:excinuclease ABC subunit A [Rhodocyclaceae bacterium]